MLSRVEHIEHLRTLPFGQRLLYSLALSVGVAAVFVLAVALAILIAVLIFTLLNSAPPALEDSMALAVPILFAFMAALGFGGNPVLIGQPLGKVARAAFRAGLVNGFITGFVFGVIWSIVAGLAAVRFERWDLIFRVQVIYFGLTLGAAISPAIGLYRAFTSIVEPLALRFVRR